MSAIIYSKSLLFTDFYLDHRIGSYKFNLNLLTHSCFRKKVIGANLSKKQKNN
jgi:hypothetical protein